MGLFWTNKSNEVSTKRNSSAEILTPAIIWVKDLIKITDLFSSAESAEIRENEREYGDKKFKVVDKVNDAAYLYIFKGEELKVILQEREAQYGLLANLVALVLEAPKKIEESEFGNIPNDIEFQDAE